jgi:uncharacterized membrane protein YjgN (DUF898 family)
MKAADSGLLQRLDRGLVAVAMAVLALLIEWLLVRSIRRRARAGGDARPRR